MGGRNIPPSFNERREQMFNASFFTYDGVFSGTYGLIIADFDDSVQANTAAFSPVLNTTKPVSLHRFYHNGIAYEAPPEFQFSILSEAIISDVLRREILSWLVGRNQFKELKVHQPDLEDYTYKCVFTNTEIIYINGHCHGFKVTANFDSHFAYGTPTVKVIPNAGTHTVTIINNSDIVDDYTYPMVKFIGTGVEIINQTDDPNRVFKFEGLASTEEVTVDNEAKFISSNTGDQKLGNFTSKKWLRLRKGINTLQITSNGRVEIICPSYAMIGF